MISFNEAGRARIGNKNNCVEIIDSSSILDVSAK